MDMFMNNLDAFVAFAMLAATGVGGWFTGKKQRGDGALGEAANTVIILTSEIDLLKEKLREKDEELAEMRGRIQTLEDLVTQRPDINGIRETVDRIARVVARDQS